MATALSVGPRALWGYRLFSALATWISIAILSAPDVFLWVSFVGFGHFFSATIYQARYGIFRKADLIKMPLLWGSIYYAYTLTQSAELLISITAVYFVWHFLVDEKRLGQERPDVLCFLEILPVLLMYTAFVLGQEFVPVRIAQGPFAGRHYNEFISGNLTSNPLSLFFAVLSLVVLLVSVRNSLVRRETFKPSTLYYYAMAVGLFILFASGATVYFTKLIAAVILFHYYNWYLHYWFKFQKDSSELKLYVSIVIGLNVIGVAVFLLNGYRPGWPRGQGFWFDPVLFYLWTLVHLIYTRRKGEFAQWLSMPGPVAQRT